MRGHRLNIEMTWEGTYMESAYEGDIGNIGSIKGDTEDLTITNIDKIIGGSIDYSHKVRGHRRGTGVGEEYRSLFYNAFEIASGILLLFDICPTDIMINT